MQSQEMMNQIMTDPQKREQSMSLIKEHVIYIDELPTLNLPEQEFSEKILQLMHKHMSDMQGLVQMP